jgi:hypothetical protein
VPSHAPTTNADPEPIEHLDVTNRFTPTQPPNEAGATEEEMRATADRVLEFVRGKLRERMKLEVRSREPLVHGNGASTYFDYRLTGPKAGTGALSVQVIRATGRVREFRLRVPAAYQPWDGKLTVSRGELFENATRDLGLGFSGGEPFTKSGTTKEGDATLIRLELGVSRSGEHSGRDRRHIYYWVTPKEQLPVWFLDPSEKTWTSSTLE